MQRHWSFNKMYVSVLQFLSQATYLCRKSRKKERISSRVQQTDNVTHRCNLYFMGRGMSMEDDVQSGRHFMTVIPGTVEVWWFVKKDLQRMIYSMPTLLVWHIDQFMQSWPLIWTSDMSLQAVFPSVDPGEKEHWVQVCKDLYQHSTDEPAIMLRFITRTGPVSMGMVQRQQQSSQWKSPSSAQSKKVKATSQSREYLFPAFMALFKNSYPWARLSTEIITNFNTLEGNHLMKVEPDSPWRQCSLSLNAHDLWAALQAQHFSSYFWDAESIC